MQRGVTKFMYNIDFKMCSGGGGQKLNCCGRHPPKKLQVPSFRSLLKMEQPLRKIVYVCVNEKNI